MQIILWRFRSLDIVSIIGSSVSMGGTYKATGINLKSIPLGESDRLLTVLTREFGLIRAIAPGARKHKSSLRGRSNLFVINNLLLVKGRSLDKVIQAESIESFPLLGNNLGKLTAGQYLAELVLCQALANQPQPELFALLWEHLTRLHQRSPSLTLASLVQATYHFLAYGGLTPQVFRCCLTQKPIMPDLANPNWSANFDAASGGIIAEQPARVSNDTLSTTMPANHVSVSENPATYSTSQASFVDYRTRDQSSSIHAGLNQFCSNPSSSASIRSNDRSRHRRPKEQGHSIQLNAKEVLALQNLAQTDILRDDALADDAHSEYGGPSSSSKVASDTDDSCIEAILNLDDSSTQNVAVESQTWLAVERVLRHYAQYHFEQPIRSASLIETCFLGP